MAYHVNPEYIEPNTYNKKQDDYGRKKQENYGRKIPVSHIAPFLDSMIMDSIDYRPGLRGLCYPGTGIIKVRGNDDDPARVNEHENTHERLNRVDPYHKESEVRMLENWRLGEEN